MRWTSLVLALVACAGDGTTDTDTDTTDTDTDTTEESGTTDETGTGAGACVSGTTWTGGDRESPLMHPGMDCIQCHTDRGDGPVFSVAGTVFTNYDEPDDCNGRSGVTVEITDADGTVYEVDTNAAGNFYLTKSTQPVDPPYTVRILVDGVETNAMLTPQSDGSCGSCHTQDGASSAPGRIIAGE